MLRITILALLLFSSTVFAQDYSDCQSFEDLQLGICGPNSAPNMVLDQMRWEQKQIQTEQNRQLQERALHLQELDYERKYSHYPETCKTWWDFGQKCPIWNLP
jgi:hypothetical protein